MLFSKRAHSHTHTHTGPSTEASLGRVETRLHVGVCLFNSAFFFFLSLPAPFSIAESYDGTMAPSGVARVVARRIHYYYNCCCYYYAAKREPESVIQSTRGRIKKFVQREIMEDLKVEKEIIEDSEYSLSKVIGRAHV